MGVYSVGEEDQGRQYGGQMLLTLDVVLLKVVALGLRGIIIFVLNFPATAAGPDEYDHALGGDPVRGAQALRSSTRPVASVVVSSHPWP